MRLKHLSAQVRLFLEFSETFSLWTAHLNLSFSVQRPYLQYDFNHLYNVNLSAKKKYTKNLEAQIESLKHYITQKWVRLLHRIGQKSLGFHVLAMNLPNGKYIIQLLSLSSLKSIGKTLKMSQTKKFVFSRNSFFFFIICSERGLCCVVAIIKGHEVRSVPFTSQPNITFKTYKSYFDIKT